MTQPGVYFTLDAPFVSIVGLYTNVLEGPGVISSQHGRYPIGDEQLHFLTAELKRLAGPRRQEQAAVVISPGGAYGTSGEGYFRISLTTPDDRLLEAVERIRRLGAA